MNHTMRGRVVHLEGVVRPPADPRIAAATVAAISLAGGAEAVKALHQRLRANTDSEADRIVLARIPKCGLEPRELIRLLVEIDEK